MASDAALHSRAALDGGGPGPGGGAAGSSLIGGDPALFRANFDARTYAFKHCLAGHPLFAHTKLLEVAQAMAKDPRDVHFDVGDVGIGQRWADVPPTKMSLPELLERIETAGAWVVLRRAELFPEYAELLNRCMAEIGALSGRNLDRLMKLRNAIIFMNSPRRVSSYHIDRECNWLLQISGRKTIHVFDKSDREVIPEEEIERFWTVDNNAAVYKPQYEGRATVFEMGPGDGVHIPVGSPHWVQNGDEVSVSLSINFHYKERLKGDIYRANYFLRRMGITPNPPGSSRFGDWTKRVIYRPFHYVRMSGRRLGRVMTRH
jgi:hypothetical protein